MSLQFYSDDSPRLLSPILGNVDLLAEIAEGCQRACYEGMKTKQYEFFPANGPGMTEYLYRCQYVGEKVVQRGWTKDEDRGQVRFLSPDVQGVRRLRLTMCTADVAGNLATAHNKGPATRRLVKDNEPFNPQLALFSGNEIDLCSPLTIWVFTRLNGSNQLTVTMAVVGALNESGTEFTIWDDEPLGFFEMNGYEPSATPLPQSVPAIVQLEELPSQTNDSSDGSGSVAI